jgi:large subunit ribosomal protein L30
MLDYILPMATIKITQVGSRIHCTKRQKLNLDALGLRKMHATVEHEATPQIMGMVNKVRHLLQVTEN